MIQASELRIGNYVTGVYTVYTDYGSDDYTETEQRVQLQILGIDSTREGAYQFIVEDKYNNYEFEHFEGIPLTDDLLFKLGFEPTHTNDWFQLYGVTLGYITNDVEFQIEVRTGFDKGFVVNVPYLHTLQNIIHSLTNQELTLKQ